MTSSRAHRLSKLSRNPQILCLFCFIGISSFVYGTQTSADERGLNLVNLRNLLIFIYGVELVLIKSPLQTCGRLVDSGYGRSPVSVGVEVMVAVGVLVGVNVGLAVAVGVNVGVGVAVSVGVAVGSDVPVAVGVVVAVAVPVGVGVAV